MPVWDGPSVRPARLASQEHGIPGSHRSSDMNKKSTGMGIGIALGAALGTALGVFAGHIAIWLGVGMAIGIAIGSTLRRQKCPNCESTKRDQELEVRNS
jgi:hypothetical protein